MPPRWCSAPSLIQYQTGTKTSSPVLPSRVVPVGSGSRLLEKREGERGLQLKLWIFQQWLRILPAVSLSLYTLSGHNSRNPVGWSTGFPSFNLGFTPHQPPQF